MSYELDAFCNIRFIMIKKEENIMQKCDCIIYVILYRIIWIRHGIKRSHGERILVQNEEIRIVLKKKSTRNKKEVEERQNLKL